MSGHIRRRGERSWQLKFDIGRETRDRQARNPLSQFSREPEASGGGRIDETNGRHASWHLHRRDSRKPSAVSSTVGIGIGRPTPCFAEDIERYRGLIGKADQTTHRQSTDPKTFGAVVSPELYAEVDARRPE